MTEITDRKGAALAFMKRASRDTFRVCANTAEGLAVQADRGELPMDAPTALRLLATWFRDLADRS